MESKKNFIQLILWILFVVLIIGAAYGSFFVWKINKIENKIDVSQNNDVSLFDTFKNLALPNKDLLKNTDGERINVLLLGIAGEGKPGKNLTDTIMIASIDTITNQVALLSLPRDLYAEIPEAHFQTKINTVYQYGLNQYKNDQVKAMEPIKKTVENITSLDIQYWVVINFDGFQKAIDTVGGINIMNERDIYDPRYPGPNYSYEIFELKKGLHHLDGSVALKYARMRHNDPEGDFGRAKRQQQVLQATKNKIFSMGTLFNALALNELLDTLGDNMKTNINPKELSGLLKLIKKLDTNNITNAVVDAWKSESLLRISHVFYKDTRAFILIPRIGNWNEVAYLAQNIFDTNEIKRNRQEISKENSRIAIINKSANSRVSTRIQKLLKESFGYRNVIMLQDSNKDTEEFSMAYDLTGGEKPFTLNEIAKKFPTKISYTLSENYRKLVDDIKIDLVIVIGKDLIERYNMVEYSIEDYNQASETNEYQEFIK